MSQVLLKNVSKVFAGDVTAVDDVSLDVDDKEFMVIVGPSGCGKTTMLRMIAGLEDVTKGSIYIGDSLVNDVAPKERDIAMVFQNYALYPHMTVYQNMEFGLKLRKYPKDEIKKRVRDAAAMLGIETLLERKPRALSGGQRQRVALGRAIVRNPQAFLFDEPLSNLDAKLRITTRAELRALHRRLQTTSIYVTHDQAEAMTLGDRICVMHKGCVHQVASPMEVYDKPVNRFVAGFLGTPPMNFFDGNIEQRNDKFVFALSDCTAIKLNSCDDKLLPFAGKPMVLGIRPEHLSLHKNQNECENGILSQVEIVEPLGDHNEVYLMSSFGQSFVANLGPHTKLQADENVTIFINVEKMHIFELGEVGKNITLS